MIVYFDTDENEADVVMDKHKGMFILDLMEEGIVLELTYEQAMTVLDNLKLFEEQSKGQMQ